MSQGPTEKEISTALEKLSITNDLEKNGENTEISSLFKPNILCAIDRIKEKGNSLTSTPDYLSRGPLTLTKFLLS